MSRTYRHPHSAHAWSRWGRVQRRDLIEAESGFLRPKRRVEVAEAAERDWPHGRNEGYTMWSIFYDSARQAVPPEVMRRRFMKTWGVRGSELHSLMGKYEEEYADPYVPFSRCRKRLTREEQKVKEKKRQEWVEEIRRKQMMVARSYRRCCRRTKIRKTAAAWLPDFRRWAESLGFTIVYEPDGAYVCQYSIPYWCKPDVAPLKLVH